MPGHKNISLILFIILLFSSGFSTAEEKKQSPENDNVIRMKDITKDSGFTDVQNLIKKRNDEILKNFDTSKYNLKSFKDQASEISKKEVSRMASDLSDLAGKSNSISEKHSVLPKETRPEMYLFVSQSMPDSLLRAYAVDAIRYAGVLVFKGIRDNQKINQFFNELSRKLGFSDGVMPPTMIDPRPFALFDVDVVPTIVIARKSVEALCGLPVTKQFQYTLRDATESLPYQTCRPAQESDYLKISGSVSTSYALKQFSDQTQYTNLVDAAKYHIKQNKGSQSDEEHQVAIESGNDYSTSQIIDENRKRQKIYEEWVKGTVDQNDFPILTK